MGTDDTWVNILIILERRQHLVGPLFLVFTENCGVEVFSFLKVKAIDTMVDLSKIEMLQPEVLCKRRNFRSFQCVMGDPMSGIILLSTW